MILRKRRSHYKIESEFGKIGKEFRSKPLLVFKFNESQNIQICCCLPTTKFEFEKAPLQSDLFWLQFEDILVILPSKENVIKAKVVVFFSRQLNLISRKLLFKIWFFFMLTVSEFPMSPHDKILDIEFNALKNSSCF